MKVLGRSMKDLRVRQREGESEAGLCFGVIVVTANAKEQGPM